MDNACPPGHGCRIALERLRLLQNRASYADPLAGITGFVLYLTFTLTGLYHSFKFKEEVTAGRPPERQLAYSWAEYVKWPGWDRVVDDNLRIRHVREHRQMYPASRRLWWCLLSYVLAVTFFLLTVVLLFKWGGAPN